jgi:hypothetical protein
MTKLLPFLFLSLLSCDTERFRLVHQREAYILYEDSEGYKVKRTVVGIKSGNHGTWKYVLVSQSGKTADIRGIKIVAVSFHKPQFGKKTNSITTYKKKK